MFLPQKTECAYRMSRSLRHVAETISALLTLSHLFPHCLSSSHLPSSRLCFSLLISALLISAHLISSFTSAHLISAHLLSAIRSQLFSFRLISFVPSSQIIPSYLSSALLTSSINSSWLIPATSIRPSSSQLFSGHQGISAAPAIHMGCAISSHWIAQIRQEFTCNLQLQACQGQAPKPISTGAHGKSLKQSGDKPSPSIFRGTLCSAKHLLSCVHYLSKAQFVLRNIFKNC